MEINESSSLTKPRLLKSVNSTPYDAESRILTFDILRGFAIMMMVVLHNLKHSLAAAGGYDRTTGVDTILPSFTTVLLNMVLYLGTWDSLFLLVSMSVNVFSIHKRLKRGVPLHKVVQGRIYWGAAIMIAGYLHNIVFGYDGIIVRTIRVGYLVDDPLYSNIFSFIALQIIGLSLILSSLLIFILYRRNGSDNLKKNGIVIITLIAVVAILTPVVQNWTQTLYPGWPVENKFWTMDNWQELPLKLFLSVIGGDPQPLFPYLITALIGTLLGMSLVHKDFRYYVPKITLGLSIGLFLIVIFKVMTGYTLQVNFFAPDLVYLAFELAGQLLFTSVLLHLVEFGSYSVQIKNNTKYLRKWGMLALTIYYLQSIELIPRYIIHLLLGWNTMQDYSLNISQSLAVLVCVLVMWRVIFKIWERIDFKWSVEYLMLYVLSSGKTKSPSRLQVNSINITT